MLLRVGLGHGPLNTSSPWKGAVLSSSDVGLSLCRLGLTGLQALPKDWRVMGVFCQAGELISGAGRLAVRGCGAERAFEATLSLQRGARSNGQHVLAKKWGFLTLSSRI